MSYIGATPQIGGYHKLDAITTDGSASYTMQLNSANFTPESANHLIVSVNGVIQAPTDSFTVSGSTITFASSLSVSDTIDFIMALGNTLDIGTPSDGTVSLSKLSATGTKDSTTFLRGDNTFAVPSDNTPAFHVVLSGNQSIADETTTKIQFNSELFDTDNAYDNSTNYRFTVPSGEGGKYFFYSQAQMNTSGYIELIIYKNGAELFKTHDAPSAVSNSRGLSTFGIDTASSGDYYEGYFFQDTSGAVNLVGNNSRTHFGAFKLIGV